jgi:hypothetical protein
MEKRAIKNIFVFVIIFSFIFLNLRLILAENKIDIQIGNAYIPGDTVKFKIIIYDEQNNIISDKVNFIVQDYYTDLIEQGQINSNEEREFKIPENTVQGYGKLVADYNNVKSERLFDVGELEKASISLEQDNLVITNVGNTAYNKPISISIGDHSETALVPLEIRQTKKIRLTAPAGRYDIRVSDGTNENTLEFSDIGLTGNVIGLESVIGDGFWKKYPLVVLFIGALLLVVVVIVGLKLYNYKNGINKNITNKNISKISNKRRK